MTALLPHLALAGLLLPAAQTTPPQAAPRPTLNHTLVFLDPAHGGDDPGARLTTPAGEPLLEKDITLALSSRLRAQLSSFGLTVLATREPDAVGPAPSALSPDARAGLANHVHPFACIILHATGTGSGVHLITSALLPAPETSALIPWDSAQAPFLAQSDRLASELSTAIARAGVPVHLSHATVRPLDNLTCPAVLVELAPLPNSSLADSGYQARVAQAVATALLFWRGHAEPDAPASSSPGPDSTSGGIAQP